MSRVFDSCPCCGAPLRPQEASCAYCGAAFRADDETHDTEALDVLLTDDPALMTRQFSAGGGYRYAPVTGPNGGAYMRVNGRLHRLPHSDWHERTKGREENE